MEAPEFIRGRRSHTLAYKYITITANVIGMGAVLIYRMKGQQPRQLEVTRDSGEAGPCTSVAIGNIGDRVKYGRGIHTFENNRYVFIVGEDGDRLYRQVKPLTDGDVGTIARAGKLYGLQDFYKMRMSLKSYGIKPDVFMSEETPATPDDRDLDEFLRAQNLRRSLTVEGRPFQRLLEEKYALEEPRFDMSATAPYSLGASETGYEYGERVDFKGGMPGTPDEMDAIKNSLGASKDQNVDYRPFIGIDRRIGFSDMEDDN